MRFNISFFSKLFALSLLISTFSSQAEPETKEKVSRGQIVRNPTLIDPGLNDKFLGVGLCQADFDSGTYRIKEPGYYYLKENIVFQPKPFAEAARPDRPTVGWFAAISIEANDVVLDLNTKSIEASQTFLSTAYASVYSDIVLQNAFTSPLIDSDHVTGIFAGETEYVAAHNVVIRNGSLGRTQYANINGVSNTNIRIYDLVCRDSERFGIALFGLNSGEIAHCCISGLEHEIAFGPEFAAATFNRILLEQIKLDFPDRADEADAFIDAMNAILDGPAQARFLSYAGYVAGIALSPLGQFANFEELHTDCVTVSDVRICNFKVAPEEAVALEGAFGQILSAGPFVMRWLDAFSGDDFSFFPSDLLRAQAFITDILNPFTLPSGFAENILSLNPDEELFIGQVTPAFGRDLLGAFAAGLYGIAVAPGDGVALERVTICDLENLGELGATLADIPAGDVFELPTTRYLGNDLVGILFQERTSSDISKAAITNFTSANGFVTGIWVTENSSCNKISNCCIRCLRAFRDDVCAVVCDQECPPVLPCRYRACNARVSSSSDCGTSSCRRCSSSCSFSSSSCSSSSSSDSCGCVESSSSSSSSSSSCSSSCSEECPETCHAPDAFRILLPSDQIGSVTNPFSQVFGIRIDRNSNAQLVTDSVVDNLTSPRGSFGYYVESGRANRFENSQAHRLIANSFDVIDNCRKFAIGFLSAASECTVFEHCQVVNARIESEDICGHTLSHAIGFALLGRDKETLDRNSVINESVTSCNHGGGGWAVGVMMNNTKCAVVTKNESFSHNSGCKGYGYLDRARCSDTLILKNIAINNKTKNYCVGHRKLGQALPLTTATNTNLRNFAVHNPWNNILFEKAPGKEQVKPKGKSIINKFKSFAS